MATLTPQHKQMLDEAIEELKTATDPEAIEDLKIEIARLEGYAAMSQGDYNDKLASLEKMRLRMQSSW